MPDYSAHRPLSDPRDGNVNSLALRPTLALQAQAHRDEARKIEKRAKAERKRQKASAAALAAATAQRETIRLGLLDVLNDKTRGYARVEAARTLLENF